MRTLNASSSYLPEPEATKLLAMAPAAPKLGTGNPASNFCATDDNRPTGIKFPAKGIRPTPPGPPVLGSKTWPCPEAPRYWLKLQFPAAARQLLCTSAVGTDVRMELPVLRRVPW